MVRAVPNLLIGSSFPRSWKGRSNFLIEFLRVTCIYRSNKKLKCPQAQISLVDKHFWVVPYRIIMNSFFNTYYYL